EGCLQALAGSLALDEAERGVQAAPVDDRYASFLHLRDECGEVLVADVYAFVEDFRHTGFVGRLLGFVCKALTIRGLVVQNCKLGVLEVGSDEGAGYGALLIVTTAGTERVPQAALGIGRVGGSRRELQDAVF